MEEIPEMDNKKYSGLLEDDDYSGDAEKEENENG